VRLVGAPPQCTVTAEKPPDQNFNSQSLSQMFTNAEANIGMGATFSNKILLRCP